MQEIKRIKLNFEYFLKKSIQVQGRIKTLRRMKNILFADLIIQNSSIQISFSDKFNLKPGDFVALEGRCFYTKKGEPTLDISKIIFKIPWKAKIQYQDLSSCKESILNVFSEKSYDKLLISFLTRSHLKRFLNNNGFLEVETPILCANYNGGRSFPVKTFYLNNFLGFNRGTMEERMQAIIGVGFKNIFQIGRIFRSSKEVTFLEGYSIELEWENGQNFIRKLLQYTAKSLKEDFLSESEVIKDLENNNWVVLDFIEECVKLFGNKVVKHLKTGKDFNNFLIREGFVDKIFSSPESLSDYISNEISKKQTHPSLIKNFLDWDSPLYKLNTENKSVKTIQRAKGFFPGQSGGFDIGMQENNYDLFLSRLEKQRLSWGIVDDERIANSDLLQVISAGIPAMFGFGINPDRISRLWIDKVDIDPFAVK